MMQQDARPPRMYRSHSTPQKPSITFANLDARPGEYAVLRSQNSLAQFNKRSHRYGRGWLRSSPTLASSTSACGAQSVKRLTSVLIGRLLASH